MDIQRIRNLTTGILYTEMSDIYHDIEYLTGEKGIMTHTLINACKSLKPYLYEKLGDHPRLFDDKYDPTHIGNIDLQPMNSDELKAFWSRYEKLPSPFA